MLSQVEMETLYSYKNIRNILKRAIDDALDDVLLDWTLRAHLIIPDWIERGINDGFYPSKNKRLKELAGWLPEYGLDNLLLDIGYAVLHKQADMTIQQCVSALTGVIPHDDPFDCARSAGELLALMHNEDSNGLYTLQRKGAMVPINVRVNYCPEISEHFRGAYEWINDTYFNLPLVECPKLVTNDNCGYHYVKESLLLGRFTQHKNSINLAAINTLNEIKWTLDKHVLNEPELTPSNLDTPEKEEVWLKQIGESGFIYKLLTDSPLFFCWQYDSRGRIYPHAYHVNLQGYEYKRALLNFNRYEYINDF